MLDDLERLQRLRDHIAQIIALGSLRPETISAMKGTLESLDRDIETLKANRVKGETSI